VFSFQLKGYFYVAIKQNVKENFPLLDFRSGLSDNGYNFPQTLK